MSRSVDDYIDKWSHDLDDAFHRLRELDHDAIADLRMAYSREVDAVVRAMLVEAIWHHHQHSVIDFLVDALRDPAPIVWKEALDGLVALACPEAIRALRSAASEEIEVERRAWINEALEQAIDGIERQKSD
jgi:hypothetical protein